MGVQRPHPRWYFIPVRVLLVTVLFTLMSFAVSVLLGIAGVIGWAEIHGAKPMMSIAYRNWGLPVAMAVAVITVIAMSVLEVRHYRQARALSAIERAN